MELLARLVEAKTGARGCRTRGIDDGINLYLRAERSGGRPRGAPVRRRAVRPPRFRLRQRRFSGERLRLLSYDAAWLRRLVDPTRVVHDRGVGGSTGAKLLDALGIERALIGTGTSMGGDDRDRLHGQARRSDDRGLRGRGARLRSRTSTAAPSSGSGVAWPSRCRGTTSPTTSRRRPSAPGSCESDKGANTFELVRSVIGVNDPFTVRQACMRDGGNGPLATRPADRAATAGGQRHARHPLSARAGAVGARRPADGGAGGGIASSSSPTSAMPIYSSARTMRCAS